LGDDGFESVHVGNSQFTEHLSVDLNATNGKSVDEFAVFDVAVGAGGGDSDDPESSEISLTAATVAEGILPRLHYLFVSALEDVLLTSPIAGCCFDDLLVPFVAHKAAFYTCHILIFLLCLRTGSHPAAYGREVVVEIVDRVSSVNYAESIDKRVARASLD